MILIEATAFGIKSQGRLVAQADPLDFSSTALADHGIPLAAKRDWLTPVVDEQRLRLPASLHKRNCWIHTVR